MSSGEQLPSDSNWQNPDQQVQKSPVELELREASEADPDGWVPIEQFPITFEHGGLLVRVGQRPGGEPIFFRPEALAGRFGSKMELFECVNKGLYLLTHSGGSKSVIAMESEFFYIHAHSVPGKILFGVVERF